MKSFRNWVQDKWYEHRDELEYFEKRMMPDYDVKEYFARVRWWLKQEYRNEIRRMKNDDNSKT